MSDKMLKNGLLYGLEMPSSYTSMEEESLRILDELLSNQPKAKRLFRMLMDDAEVTTLFNLANFIAVRKLGYNDHGPIHAKIVAANGMRLLRLLLDSGKVELDSMSALGLSEDDAHLVVLAGCMLHDVGNAVHRIQHEIFSVMYAKTILERLLPGIYPDVSQRTAIIQQVLHTQYAHDVGENALTVEAAVVVIADGCDITKGRGRMAYDLGKHDIHSISALSIESVEITGGKEKLIGINVRMSNSAGIYQLQETLVKKVAKSILRDYIEIVAELVPPKTTSDLKVFDRIVFSDGKYQNV
jgi:metal-dependent HD superfamily phosphatase/phosphodiesterase